jgi:phage gp45-like
MFNVTIDITNTTYVNVAAQGIEGSVQYNENGSLAGNSNFVYNGTNVGIGTASPSNKLEIIEDLKLSFFVEDRHKTCCRLSRYCKTFMVNQPWNVKYNTTANNSITRVNDIKDVYGILEKESVKKEK